MIYSERDWLKTEVLEGDSFLTGIQIEMNTRRLDNVLMYITRLSYYSTQVDSCNHYKIVCSKSITNKTYFAAVDLIWLKSKNFLKETKRGEQRQV